MEGGEDEVKRREKGGREDGGRKKRRREVSREKLRQVCFSEITIQSIALYSRP